MICHLQKTTILARDEFFMVKKRMIRLSTELNAHRDSVSNSKFYLWGFSTSCGLDRLGISNFLLIRYLYNAYMILVVQLT